MLSKLIKRGFGGSAPLSLREGAKPLAKTFESVVSVSEVKHLLVSLGLLKSSGLDAEAVALLFDVTRLMRANGLGLEPNLVGRATCMCILGRPAAGSASTLFAINDEDFSRHTASGDTKRNAGHFAEAQFNYWLALQLFPCHHGYLVQYAHCLKERSLAADAVVNYLDAYLYGAPASDIAQHLLFAVQQIASSERASDLLALSHGDEGAGDAMSLRPSSRDARSLVELLHNRVPAIDEVAALMCSHMTRKSIIKHLIGAADFGRAHRSLLQMTAELERDAP